MGMIQSALDSIAIQSLSKSTFLEAALNNLSPVIAVIGNSLFLAGVAASLRCDLGGIKPAWQVIEIAPDGKGLADLEGHAPNLLLVDAAQSTSEQLATLMSACPNRPIIALDADAQQLTVRTSHQYPAASFADLAQVIEKLSPTFATH
jgi:hypothetical protein